jgi:hypothetical protein
MAHDNELTEAMNMEDRLKGIAYQFIALYERWSEDRKKANEQAADTAVLVKIFTEQVKEFKELSPQVRQKIMTSIQNAASGVGKAIGEEVSKASTLATENTARQLAQSVDRAEKILNNYEGEVVTSQWKVISVAALITVTTCFLIFKFLMPVPTLPLSDKQIEYLHSGEMMSLVWTKLTKKEQQHWKKLADQIEHPEQGSDNNSAENE